MNRVSTRDLQRSFDRHGAGAWLDLVLRYGPTFEAQRTFFTADPEVVRAVLMERPHTVRRSTPHRFISRMTPGSAGLLFMDGEVWRRHLRAVTPAFRKQHVEGFSGAIAAQTRSHAAWWARHGQLPDLYQSVSRLSIPNALRVGYGLDPGHPLVQELARELLDYKFRTVLRSPEWRLDTVPFALGPHRVAASVYEFWQLRRSVARLRSRVWRVLAEPLTRLAEPSWIAGLLQEEVAFEPLVDEINHLYGAYNAIDYVVSCALLELSRRPEWRARLRAEVDGVLGDRDWPAHDDLPRLARLWDFMREVLRLYPVAMCIFRRTGEPLMAGGGRIPAGRTVAILPYALHRHPDLWAEPEAFEPDRWGGSAEPRVPFSYVPFLLGPRRCIGRDLAELEFLTVISTLLRHFDIEVLDTTPQVLPVVVPRFDRPLPFRVRARA